MSNLGNAVFHAKLSATHSSDHVQQHSVNHHQVFPPNHCASAYIIFRALPSTLQSSTRTWCRLLSDAFPQSRSRTIRCFRKEEHRSSKNFRASQMVSNHGRPVVYAMFLLIPPSLVCSAHSFLMTTSPAELASSIWNIDADNNSLLLWPSSAQNSSIPIP